MEVDRSAVHGAARRPGAAGRRISDSARPRAAAVVHGCGYVADPRARTGPAAGLVSAPGRAATSARSEIRRRVPSLLPRSPRSAAAAVCRASLPDERSRSLCRLRAGAERGSRFAARDGARGCGNRCRAGPSLRPLPLRLPRFREGPGADRCARFAGERGGRAQRRAGASCPPRAARGRGPGWDRRRAAGPQRPLGPQLAGGVHPPGDQRRDPVSRGCPGDARESRAQAARRCVRASARGARSNTRGAADLSGRQLRPRLLHPLAAGALPGDRRRLRPSAGPRLGIHGPAGADGTLGDLDGHRRPGAAAGTRAQPARRRVRDHQPDLVSRRADDRSDPRHGSSERPVVGVAGRGDGGDPAGPRDNGASSRTRGRRHAELSPGWRPWPPPGPPLPLPARRTPVPLRGSPSR